MEMARPYTYLRVTHCAFIVVRKAVYYSGLVNAEVSTYTYTAGRICTENYASILLYQNLQILCVDMAQSLNPSGS